MIRAQTRPRQPRREPWSLERLLQERAIALEHALDQSTKSTYSSALNSYLAFCEMHTFPIAPTEQTLSFYVIFQCHHIEPRSVDSYLSGICSELEPFYPDIRKARSSPLVACTLKGAKRLFSKLIRRKRALDRAAIELMRTQLLRSDSLDDKLFLALTLTAFHGLLRLGEIVWPDRVDHQSYDKVRHAQPKNFVSSYGRTRQTRISRAPSSLSNQLSIMMRPSPPSARISPRETTSSPTDPSYGSGAMVKSQCERGT